MSVEVADLMGPGPDPASDPASRRELPLFPLNVVLFPGMRLPLHIFEERYKLMIGTCMVTDQTFGVALIKSGQEVGGPATVYAVGTTARILEMDRLPEGRINLVAVGVERFRIVERGEDRPYATGTVELLAEPAGRVPRGLTERAAQQFRRYLVERGMTAEQAESLRLPSQPTALSYVVAANLALAAAGHQKLLQADSTEVRLRRELALLEWKAGGSTTENARSFSLN